MRRLSIVLCAFLCLGPALADPAVPAKAGDTKVLSNVVETLRAHGEFDTFAEFMKTAGIVELVANAGPITVFAPTDEAWEQLPAARLRLLRTAEHRDELRELLLHHIIGGETASTSFSGKQSAASLAGYDVVVTATMTAIRIDDATLVIPDVRASNGVIHGIDAVLRVPDAPATLVVGK